MQTHFSQTGSHKFELLPPTPENGFRLLPAPSDGDIFFDMEGYPYFESAAGLEYLFGLVTKDERFCAWHASNRAEEKKWIAELKSKSESPATDGNSKQDEIEMLRKLQESARKPDIRRA